MSIQNKVLTAAAEILFLNMYDKKGGQFMKAQIFMFFLLTCLLVISLIAVAQENYSYDSDIKQVMENHSCTSCHKFAKSYSGLLSAKSSDILTKGIYTVSPGNPDSSVIIWRINGVLPSGELLKSMPVNGKPLDRESRDMVRAWIEMGAPEAINSYFIPSPVIEIKKTHLPIKVFTFSIR